MVPWLGGNCGAGGDLWGAEGQGSFLRRGGVQKTPTTFTTLTDGKRVAAGGLLLALVLIGCDSGDGSSTAPSAQTATVRFDYRASTSLNPILTPASPTCVSAVGHTHIHPSWRGFARVDMQAVGADLWQITFTDVPVDERLSIRISDANVCDKNATGASTDNVFANDVVLVDIVSTPGSGPEPGLAFTVDATGTVTP